MSMFIPDKSAGGSLKRSLGMASSLGHSAFLGVSKGFD
jgi:hypothetical protein